MGADTAGGLYVCVCLLRCAIPTLNHHQLLLLPDKYADSPLLYSSGVSLLRFFQFLNFCLPQTLRLLLDFMCIVYCVNVSVSVNIMDL